MGKIKSINQSQFSQRCHKSGLGLAPPGNQLSFELGLLGGKNRNVLVYEAAIRHTSELVNLWGALFSDTRDEGSIDEAGVHQNSRKGGGQDGLIIDPNVLLVSILKTVLTVGCCRGSFYITAPPPCNHLSSQTLDIHSQSQLRLLWSHVCQPRSSSSSVYFFPSMCLFSFSIFFIFLLVHSFSLSCVFLLTELGTWKV